MSRQYVSDAELAAEWPHLTRRMLRDLKDAFALFDLDGGGTISTSELGEVLKSMGTNATQEELEAIIHEVDVYNTGEIDFPEFLVMTLRQLKVDPEKELQGLFEALDSDGSGKINTLKLRDALGVLGEKLSPDEVDEIIRLADASGDGEVDLHEFVNFFLGKGGKR